MGKIFGGATLKKGDAGDQDLGNVKGMRGGPDSGGLSGPLTWLLDERVAGKTGRETTRKET